MPERTAERLDEPRLESRRTREFAAELVARARAWQPDWNPDQVPGDPGRALLDVSARLLTQVAERLDRVGEKDRRNFYSWLGIRGRAAQGASLPVVFKLADGSAGGDSAGLLAPKPVRMQFDVSGATLVFETAQDLRLVRAKVALVVAVDPQRDAFYLPADGFASLEPRPLLPSRWQVLSLAAQGSSSLQLDPPLGLAPGMIIRIGEKQFAVTGVNADIVTVEPPIDVSGGIGTDMVATRVDDFAPFEPDDSARSQQLHALYIGHNDLFNLESTATVEIENGQALGRDFSWQYWGKGAGPGSADQTSRWRDLDLGKPDTKHPNALVLDKAVVGAVEPRMVAGVQSRWLRASIPTLASASPPLALADLRIRVGTNVATPTRPAMEGLANTTPLVLDDAFLPLGREPRQFDAFYLGCAEVFAKHGAIAKLTFDIADATFATLVAFRAVPGSALVAGIGQDGSLHLFTFDTTTGALTTLAGSDALQPPDAGPGGHAALVRKPVWRLPIWGNATGVYIAVVAGRSVWIRHQIPFGSIYFGEWQPAGKPVAGTGTVSALAYAAAAIAGVDMLYAVCDAALYSRPALSQVDWTQLTVAPALEMLVAIDAGVAGAGADRLVGIDAAGVISVMDELGQVTATATAPTALASPDVQPIAMKGTGPVLVVAAGKALDKLIAIQFTPPQTVELGLGPNEQVVGLASDDSVGRSVVATVADKAGAGSRLLWWTPDFSAVPAQAESFDAPIAATDGALAGAPLPMSPYVVVPGAQASVFELPLVAAASAAAPVQLWARLPTLATTFGVGDVLTVRRDALIGFAPISQPEVSVGGDRYLPLGAVTLHADVPPTTGFHTQVLLSASFEHPLTNRRDILLADADALDVASPSMLVIVPGTTVLVRGMVDKISVPGTTRVVLTDALPPAIPDPFTYSAPIDLSAAQLLTVVHFENGSAAPDPSSASDLRLTFAPGTVPQQRRAHVLTRSGDGRPAVAALDPASEWTTRPPVDAFGRVDYRIEAKWTRPISVTESNPELSWEYANGRSWWKLSNDFTDTTNNLKIGGDVSFRVPDDIVASDWAGRSNFWIRARLVGGDYGKEVFTVTSNTVGSVTTQSSTRSTDGVRPPVVVSVEVSYTMDAAVLPDFVFAEDAGNLRNQSDANRTAGAVVEAFVPLAVELGRLEAAPRTATPAGEVAACCAHAASPCLPGTNEVAAATVGTVTGKRSLFVGIDGVAEGAPVNLLLTVGEEHDLDFAAPLAVDALVGGRFEPVVATDATRALGESGIVSMAIAHAPTVTELFGRSLSWLRLTPSSDSGWQPSLAGAWLNAAWADAAETQTLEVLGSSQGAPGMGVSVARRPLLGDSLELRVNEPLGDEEVAALRAIDPAAVLTEVEGLGGRWVRWKAVDDPEDAAAGERVYAVDEATGDVRFGDGLHGMIPPIGRDNIVAFKYRRTEPLKAPAPGQAPPQVAVAARSSLDLVTPLVGVEAAIAALDSDAGAPADDAARVLRFGPELLRHRGRAVTPGDVEAIALQAEPAIAQARCLRSGTMLRLVLVMRGPDISPTRAVQRKLKRILLAAMPPALNAPGSGLALEFVAPKPRHLRVRARLAVESLELAGAVAANATAALQARLDPMSGGDDGVGWPLGASPSEGDVEAAVIDIANLDGIESLELLEITATAERPWPAQLADDELAVLGEDGFDLTYRLPEPA